MSLGKFSIRISLALLFSACAFSQASAGGGPCSDYDVKRLTRAFLSNMSDLTLPVVTFGSDKSASLAYCDKYSDGFIVTGYFEEYGTDDAYYKIKGRMITNEYYGAIKTEVVDANANFVGLLIIKGLTVATLYCSSSDKPCSN